MLRLGLDLGTNSIGWVLYRLNNAEPVEVVAVASRFTATDAIRRAEPRMRPTVAPSADRGAIAIACSAGADE